VATSAKVQICPDLIDRPMSNVSATEHLLATTEHIAI